MRNDGEEGAEEEISREKEQYRSRRLFRFRLLRGEERSDDDDGRGGGE